MDLPIGDAASAEVGPHTRGTTQILDRIFLTTRLIKTPFELQTKGSKPMKKYNSI